MVLHHVEYHSTVELVEQNQCRVTLDNGVDRVKNSGARHCSFNPNAQCPFDALHFPQKLSVKKEQKLFPINEMHLYTQSVFMPNSAYRVPTDTRYILFCTQKNYFSLDIVSEDFEIPFSFKDPIKNRISRIPGLYDRPPKTPYIEDEPT